MSENAQHIRSNGRHRDLGPRRLDGAPQPAEASPMKRRINPRVLLLAIALVTVLAVGTYLVHGFQVGRNAAVVLREANRYEAEGDETRTLEYLSRYLGLAPKDNETYARYALLLDKMAKAPRAKIQAFLVLEQALRREPTRSDIRRTVVKSAMTMQRYLDAIVHLKILLKETPDVRRRTLNCSS